MLVHIHVDINRNRDPDFYVVAYRKHGSTERMHTLRVEYGYLETVRHHGIIIMIMILMMKIITILIIITYSGNCYQ